MKAILLQRDYSNRSSLKKIIESQRFWRTKYSQAFMQKDLSNKIQDSTKQPLKTFRWNPLGN